MLFRSEFIFNKKKELNSGDIDVFFAYGTDKDGRDIRLESFQGQSSGVFTLLIRENAFNKLDTEEMQERITQLLEERKKLEDSYAKDAGLFDKILKNISFWKTHPKPRSFEFIEKKFNAVF